MGERGARLMDGDAEVFVGRFNERLGCWVDRLGVAGKVGRLLSSLLGGRLKSPVEGCVEDVGLEASDNDRDLGERVGGSGLGGSGCSCWLNLLSNGCADVERAGPGGRDCAIV